MGYPACRWHRGATRSKVTYSYFVLSFIDHLIGLKYHFSQTCQKVCFIFIPQIRLPEIDSRLESKGGGNSVTKYIIDPLESAEVKHNYVARLNILDVTSHDEEYQYTLMVGRKKEEDEPITETANYS